MIENRIVIIKRSTRLDELIGRYNTIGQARFYIEHLGASFYDYEVEHKNYYNSLNSIKTKLTPLARIQILDRAFLPNYIFAPNDIIVVVGQDGLVANTLKYLDGQPTLGINPDPKRWDGVLLPFVAEEVYDVIRQVVSDSRAIRSVTMGQVNLQNGQQMLAVNDFFVGQKGHASARYEITFGSISETQSSSGVIVSTGLGASGWLKSVLTGASGIYNSISGASQKNKQRKPVPWDSDYLTFSVREPWKSKITGTDIIFGKVPKGTILKIVSSMGENGVIFSDGIEKDNLEFNSGMEAIITIAKKNGNLVI